MTLPLCECRRVLRLDDDGRADCRCGRVYNGGEVVSQHRPPRSREQGVPCSARGERVGVFKCGGCEGSEPLYQCSLYGEDVLLRPKRRWTGRNCLDCKMDGEGPATTARSPQ